MDGGVLEEGRGEDPGRFEDGDDDAMVMVDGGVWRLWVTRVPKLVRCSCLLSVLVSVIINLVILLTLKVSPEYRETRNHRELESRRSSRRAGEFVTMEWTAQPNQDMKGTIGSYTNLPVPHPQYLRQFGCRGGLPAITRRNGAVKLNKSR